MGKPFHFLQSIVEKKGVDAEDGDADIPRNQSMLHGEKMEIVIREAYELLTGMF